MGSSKSRAINPAFTNVSHTAPGRYVTSNKPRLAGFKVHKLTFGKEPYSLQSRLPREYRSQVRPLAARSEQLSPRKRAEDGRTFTVDKFHKELSHFIKA